METTSQNRERFPFKPADTAQAKHSGPDLDVKLTLDTLGGNAPWGMSRWDTPKEPPPMFRFTIRDVLWLTVVVAMGVCLYQDRTSIRRLTGEKVRMATAFE